MKVKKSYSLEQELIDKVSVWAKVLGISDSALVSMVFTQIDQVAAEIITTQQPSRDDEDLENVPSPAGES